MKVIFPFSALTFFLFLAYLTHPGKRDETPQSVEKQDFFFKDFIYGTTITGSWIDEDYMVKMETNSIRLDMKLVFEFIESVSSADINSSPNGNRTPKHGKIHKFKDCPKYPRNATCQDFKTFRPRTHRFLERAWDVSCTIMTVVRNRCSDITVAVAIRGWDGVIWLAEWIWHKVILLADGIWNGVTWTAERVWNGVTWLADRVWNGVTWLAERIWNGVTWLAEWTWSRVAWMAELFWNGIAWLAEWIWNGVVWLFEWTWDGVTWLAEWIWNGLTWTGRLFLPGNYVTDGVVKFYYGYLDNHVNHIGARIAASTWQDVFLLMSAVVVVNFALLVIYLLVTCTVHFMQRLWQARKDRITADNLPPVPKKPIWRPKPKKKRRKNKNGW